MNLGPSKGCAIATTGSAVNFINELSYDIIQPTRTEDHEDDDIMFPNRDMENASQDKTCSQMKTQAKTWS